MILLRARVSGPFGLALVVLMAAGWLPLAAQAVPYGIDRRPQPRGTVLDTLLPSTVGSFHRADFTRLTPVPVNEELIVKYGAGRDSVALSFKIPGLREVAQAAVRLRRDRARGSDRGTSATSGDPSYFRGERLFAWSRGGYYFAADASSPEALDRFMQAFPY